MQRDGNRNGVFKSLDDLKRQLFPGAAEEEQLQQISKDTEKLGVSLASRAMAHILGTDDGRT